MTIYEKIADLRTAYCGVCDKDENSIYCQHGCRTWDEIQELRWEKAWENLLTPAEPSDEEEGAHV